MSYRNQMCCNETKIEQFVDPLSTTKIIQPSLNLLTHNTTPQPIKRLLRNSFNIGSNLNNSKMFSLNNGSNLNSINLNKDVIRTQNRITAIERSQSQSTQRSNRMYDTSSKGQR